MKIISNEGKLLPFYCQTLNIRNHLFSLEHGASKISFLHLFD